MLPAANRLRLSGRREDGGRDACNARPAHGRRQASRAANEHSTRRLCLRNKRMRRLSIRRATTQESTPRGAEQTKVRVPARCAHGAPTNLDQTRWLSPINAEHRLKLEFKGTWAVAQASQETGRPQAVQELPAGCAAALKVKLFMCGVWAAAASSVLSCETQAITGKCTGFCPAEEFQRTKHDFGTCLLDHDDAAKAQVGHLLTLHGKHCCGTLKTGSKRCPACEQYEFQGHPVRTAAG